MVGRTAFDAKDWTAARSAYGLALNVDPYNHEALNALGRLALTANDINNAIGYFSESFIQSEQPSTAVNLAIAYGRQKDFTQALQYCAEAIVLDRNFLPAYIQHAAIYEELAQPEDAEIITNRALELFPGNSQLLYGLSIYQLQRGDFENGWRNYEHRKPRLEIAARLDEYQEWNGEPLTQGHVWVNGSTYCAKCGGLGIGQPICPQNGKTILVVGEQGVGDEIQFARYLPLLAELGAQVVFRTRCELARLFSEAFPDVRIVTSDAELVGIEPDYWTALCSLLKQRTSRGADHLPRALPRRRRPLRRSHPARRPPARRPLLGRQSRASPR